MAFYRANISTGLRGWRAENPTWRHVKSGSATKVIRDVVLGGKTEVCKLHCQTAIGDQDVLRLEIPMVDTNGMAEVDRI